MNKNPPLTTVQYLASYLVSILAHMKYRKNMTYVTVRWGLHPPPSPIGQALVSCKGEESRSFFYVSYTDAPFLPFREERSKYTTAEVFTLFKVIKLKKKIG